MQETAEQKNEETPVKFFLKLPEPSRDLWCATSKDGFCLRRDCLKFPALRPKFADSARLARRLEFPYRAM